jgi:AcrR family transcriptional regulator
VDELAAKQQRSKLTFDKLIESGFRLLENREWDAVSVADIAQQAGYSVGAFYARFKTKDEFLRALVTRFAAERIADVERMFSDVPDEDLLTAYFDDIVTWLWHNRFFWRACLFRSIQDPNFWGPMRDIGGEVEKGLKARAAQRIGRALSASEALDLSFALQVTYGAINNMLYSSGPVALEDPDYIVRLERAFRRVSGWDELR